MADQRLTVEVARGSEVLTRPRRLRLFVAFRGVTRAGRSPWLVVRNGNGEIQPMWAEADMDQANAKRERLLRELDELGAEAWCDRYNVPATFAQANE